MRTFSSPAFAASSMRSATSSSMPCPRLDDDFVRDRVHDVFGRDASQHAVRDRLDDVLAVLERADREAADRAAVRLVDDHVLGDVDETPRQVAGIGRLERRVGQALAGAVRRDEVLEHGQPFLEVVDDRRLDDLTQTAGDLLLRLRHQTAHAGELTHLLAVTARARVRHHEDRVEAVSFLRQTVERDLLDLGRGVRPRVDDPVVALALGDDAGAVVAR